MQNEDERKMPDIAEDHEKRVVSPKAKAAKVKTKERTKAAESSCVGAEDGSLDEEVRLET